MKKASQFELYGSFGHYYDLHTPAHHYQHDHVFVIREIQKHHPRAHILDIGCGSGVFLQKALQAGLNAFGIDPAPSMLKLACQKVGQERVQLLAMEEIKAVETFDAMTALSWSLNYAGGIQQISEILKRIKRALRPGGLILFQIAHAPHAPNEFPEFFIDHEAGPGGPEDITFKYRFAARDHHTLVAQYHFSCHSTGEHFEEEHLLQVANVKTVAEIVRNIGFKDVRLIQDFHGRPFQKTFNPFLIASRPSEQ